MTREILDPWDEPIGDNTIGKEHEYIDGAFEVPRHWDATRKGLFLEALQVVCYQWGVEARFER